MTDGGQETGGRGPAKLLGRGLAELLVIVAGVLIALWIEGWREARIAAESFPGSRRTELWIRPWPSLDGGVLVAESDAPGFGWGEAKWTQDGRTFLHVEADSVVLSDVSASGPNLQVEFRRRIGLPGPRMGDDVLNVAPDRRLLGASSGDANQSLPAHEQNRVMLLTGLKERIRRMDPAGGGP